MQIFSFSIFNFIQSWAQNLLFTFEFYQKKTLPKEYVLHSINLLIQPSNTDMELINIQHALKMYILKN